jgi:pyrrolysine biosynthesis protein PylD
MTRLLSEQVLHIPEQMTKYNHVLRQKIGCDLLELGNYITETQYSADFLSENKIAVIPISSGEGLIKGFSKAVAGILDFIGFDAFITENIDFKGIEEAYQKKADIIFMADDDTFLALNLQNKKCVNNNLGTAKAYVNALELMTSGLNNEEVFVLGLGPIGMKSIELLIEKNIQVGVYDIDESKIRTVKEQYNSQVEIFANPKEAFKQYDFIIEATPANDTILEGYLDSDTYIAAPGVPLGVNELAFKKVEDKLIHDPLQLGVVVMAFEVL